MAALRRLWRWVTTPAIPVVYVSERWRAQRLYTDGKSSDL